jgi:riboflavin kinase/FMN adenylyltransferase
MKIIRDLNTLNGILNPFSLTIGNFDGVHLGHQFLLDHLTRVAKENNGQSVVVTFENHPKSVIDPHFQSHSICTLPHKIMLLKEAHVDVLVLLPFTEHLMEQTADVFFKSIHKAIPFSELILGHDAVFGKNRQGTKETIRLTAQKLNIKATYLEPFKIGNTPVSSSLIRTHIKTGDLNSIKTWLGRKYSIYGEVIKGLGNGKIIGFPTANIDVSDLCLPPYGVYAVLVEYEGTKQKALANLGIAPTVRETSIPLLEIHLLEHQDDIYGKELNVILESYIRPEIRFSSIEELKKQITQDIESTRAI